MRRRFWWGTALGLPVFTLAMTDMVLGAGLGGRIDRSVTNWLGLVLTTPVVWWAGRPFFERAWTSVANRSANMFTLIALGIGAAYMYSAAATLAPALFPEGFRMHGVVETYFDSAVVITVLVLLGQVLELRARSQTGSAIRQLLRLAPTTAHWSRPTVSAMFRSRTCASATSCAFVRARRSRLMGSCWRATARSTSRW